MANFTPSDLVEGQALFNEKHVSGEWRVPNSNAFKTANTGMLANPSLAGLRTREDRAVSAKFPIRQASTGGTDLVALHTGARGDSLSESINWSSFSETFSISITQGDNNVLSFAEMLASSQKNAMWNLIRRVDNWYVAQLIADKTQYSEGGGFGTFNAAFDYEVDLTDERFFFQNVKAMMENNDYTNGLTGVLDSQAGVLKGELAAQGGANNTNTQFQFAGYDDLQISSKTILDVPTTYTASGLFFETGLVGVIPWIPQKNRKDLDPRKVMDNVGDFGQMMIPELNIPMSVSAYSTRADASGSNGSAQDVVIQYELGVSVGFSAAPLSDFRGASDSVIYSAAVGI